MDIGFGNTIIQIRHQQFCRSAAGQSVDGTAKQLFFATVEHIMFPSAVHITLKIIYGFGFCFSLNSVFVCVGCSSSLNRSVESSQVIHEVHAQHVNNKHSKIVMK